MQFLKQSTAVTLKIGPFLDDTDFKTAETGLTITQADVRISRNGGDLFQKGSATACTHDELGIYGCPIDASDTAVLGRLQLWVHEAGALPVYHEYMIVPDNIYDSYFSTDKLEVDLLQIGGDSQSRTDLKDLIDTGYDPVTHKVEGVKLTDTTTTNTDTVTVDQVNAQVLDVLNVDTFAEPGQGTPATTTTLVEKIGYLYKFLRNRITNDGSTTEVYNDGEDTVDHKATVSDDGTTVTREKFGSGP